MVEMLSYAGAVALLIGPPVMTWRLLRWAFSPDKHGDADETSTQEKNAKALVTIVAASGFLVVLVVGIFWLSPIVTRVRLAWFVVGATILCIPRVLWSTRWRQQAIQLSAYLVGVSVVVFMSVWPVVASVFALLLGANSLLQRSRTKIPRPSVKSS
jgi:hypothetical protein